MILEDADDILELRRGNGYGLVCRIRGYVYDGFPAKNPPKANAGQRWKYATIHSFRTELRYRMRTNDQDNVFWDRRLA